MRKNYEKIRIDLLTVDIGPSILSGSIVEHATVQTMGQELSAPKSFDELSIDDSGHTFNQDWEGGSL